MARTNTSNRLAIPANDTIMDSAALIFNEGTSDKVYFLYLIRAADRTPPAYFVRSDWGRRGSSLQTTIKPGFPTSFSIAQDIYRSILAEKTGKGYQYEDMGAPRMMESGEVVRIGGASRATLRPAKPTPVLCPTCSRMFESQERLNEHVRIAHVKLYPCPLCAVEFTEESNLTLHMQRRHAGGLPVKPRPGAARPAFQNQALPKTENPSITARGKRRIVLDDDE